MISIVKHHRHPSSKRKTGSDTVRSRQAAGCKEGVVDLSGLDEGPD